MSAANAPATVREWLAEPMPHDVRARVERLRRSEGIAHVAVMPDVHLSQSFCIGTVVASPDRLYPEAVGGDIGCGMAAVRVDADARDVVGSEAAAERIFRVLRRLVPLTRHGRRTAPETLPEELTARELSTEALVRAAGRDGRMQLGTLGGGNHFLELQCDDEGWLWFMVHSGSRGMGQAIARHHLARCFTEEGGLRYLLADSEAGKDYLRDVEWARAYAHHNRLEMIDAAGALLEELFGVSVDESTLVTSDHNHVQAEGHFGGDVLVHRKGALSAREGEPGLVPGSMGTESFHTEGRGCADALTSSSHGAGRAMSRSRARNRISTRDLGRQMKGVWFERGAAARLRDEAPAAYKDLRAVMKAQRELTKVVRRVRPVLVYKG